MLDRTDAGVVPVERYWVPAGHSSSLTADGWLDDPAVGGLYRPNAEAVTTGNLVGESCVVLLGEPGMGKTSAIRAHGPLTHPDTTIETLHVDLGTFSSEERLARRVFENATVTAWITGSNTLCLTLDSFDEAHNRIENLHQMLADYLEDWDCGRLLLRIACRTADWPASLRTTLDRKFGQANVHELLPLRRDDAARLLGASGVDPDEFIATVEAAHVVPLAARPLTLNLLRAAMRTDGSLPHRTAEIYSRGLFALADEMNPERRDARRPTPGAAERIEVATRVAAISVFGGRPIVWTGPHAHADPADLTLDDCIRTNTGDRLPVLSAETVEATLHTGLFTGKGENRLGWSHATFADHLAARWISTNKLSDAQVCSLLLSHDGRIHARVRQVAARLVSMAPDRFHWLIAHDPEAFLVSVDIPEEVLRRELVAALFADARAGVLYDHYGLNLTGLGHSELADQLRVALADASHRIVRLAISIARQCQIRAVVPELVALALSTAVDAYIRVSAAMAIRDLSVEEPNHELATLLNSTSSGEDEARPWELEAAVLMASWPHAISTAEVFGLLNPRYPRNYSGLYWLFISDFAKGLTYDDLNVACDWLMAEPARPNDKRVAPIVNAIVRLCLEHLDEPKYRQTLKHVALSRVDHYKPLFSQKALTREPELEIDDQRMLALLVLEDATNQQALSVLDAMGKSGLVGSDDLAWLIEQYASAEGTLEENLKTVLTHVYNPFDTAHSERVLGLPDDHPAAEVFGFWRSSIELDSPEADAARSQWREHVERMERLQTHPDEGDERINPDIGKDIEEAKLGDTQAFWVAARRVTVPPGTQHYMDEFEPDLTAHPRWATLPLQTRQDFIAAAPTYLHNGRCEPERWLAQDRHYFPAEAGYRAFILLLRERPEELERLPGHIWREWAPILISWPVATESANAGDKRELIRVALPHARHELTATLLKLIDKAIADGQRAFLREELSLLASEPLTIELVARLAQPMAPELREEILDVLMEDQADLAPILVNWLRVEQRVDDPARARAAAMRLLHFNARRAWPVLRELMDTDSEFMEAAFLSMGYAYEYHTPDLTELEIAELYVWLSRHFPAREDPQFEDAHFVGPRESLASWRDSLLGGLRRRGTKDAVVAVEHIVAAFPEKEWLGNALVDAQRAYRERTWEPLSPYQLDQLANSPNAHLVRTDEDLAAATLEALDAVQQRLQGDTPSANLLWDSHSRRPKSEEEISDYLKIELERQLLEYGVVVNREVQVRRIKPAGLPERTDLRIEALPTQEDQAAGPLKIPGEVKGAWNAGVINSVESQLIDRYMADFQTNYGIYIAIWFDLESWADNDSRKKQAASHGSREHIDSALKEQAARQLENGKKIAVVVLDASLRRPTATSSASGWDCC